MSRIHIKSWLEHLVRKVWAILDLAMKKGLPLATQDKKLRKAASELNIPLLWISFLKLSEQNLLNVKASWSRLVGIELIIYNTNLIVISLRETIQSHMELLIIDYIWGENPISALHKD